MISDRLAIAVTSVLVFSAVQSGAGSAFTKVMLPKNVSIDIPTNWTVMSDGRRTTLAAWKESILEAKKLSDAENEMPFSASYDEDGITVASITVRYYPSLDTTLMEADSGGASFVEALDKEVRESFVSGLEVGGGKSVSWTGTKKRTINGSVYFVTDSRFRPPRTDGSQSVNVSISVLVRHINASKSFTIILAYREDRALFLGPICDKIINSIAIAPAAKQSK